VEIWILQKQSCYDAIFLSTRSKETRHMYCDGATQAAFAARDIVATGAQSRQTVVNVGARVAPFGLKSRVLP
jgi:hypothetical protein